MCCLYMFSVIFFADDHNRIALNPVADSIEFNSGDYINASYIDVSTILLIGLRTKSLKKLLVDEHFYDFRDSPIYTNS